VDSPIQNKKNATRAPFSLSLSLSQSCFGEAIAEMEQDRFAEECFVFLKSKIKISENIILKNN